jgi:hypothetical protein
MATSNGIFWCKGKWNGRLAIVARPRGDDWLSDGLAAYRIAGFDVIVSLLVEDETLELGLKDEAKLAVEHSINFINFPIDDYGVPASTDTMLGFIRSLLQELNDGKTVGIHCRQSVGRSSLVVACLSVLAGDNPQSAFREIERARGVPVPDTIEQRLFVEAFSDALLVASR